MTFRCAGLALWPLGNHVKAKANASGLPRQTSRPRVNPPEPGPRGLPLDCGGWYPHLPTVDTAGTAQLSLLPKNSGSLSPAPPRNGVFVLPFSPSKARTPLASRAQRRAGHSRFHNRLPSGLTADCLNQMRNAGAAGTPGSSLIQARLWSRIPGPGPRRRAPGPAEAIWRGRQSNPQQRRPFNSKVAFISSSAGAKSLNKYFPGVEEWLSSQP